VRYFLEKGSDEMEKKQKKEQVIFSPPMVPSIYDPMGCYTGLPRDPFEKPVQDADDL
jgi:hypothetical protein